MFEFKRAADDCTKVTVECPVEGAIYGYAPNSVASYAFCIIFVVCGLLQTIQMIKWRTWSFGIAVILGAISEAAGMWICSRADLEDEADLVFRIRWTHNSPQQSIFLDWVRNPNLYSNDGSRLLVGCYLLDLEA